MADSSNPKPAEGTGSAQPAASKSASKPANPAFRMMGLPNIKFRLPSRNWMIFWTITGSFTAALIYDRREKRRAQQKWCDLVAHLSKETLPVEQMRRKITVFLAAPPGDGLRVARDHFKEYVKPILVAASVDYQVIEGRREGEVRAGLAEHIRRNRRRAGEPSTVVEEPSAESVVYETRTRIGVTDEPGPKGDLVIGRHTWKEYIRGLHEGWLGPLDPPPPPPSASEDHQPQAPASEEQPPSPSPEGSPESSETKPDTPSSEEKKDDAKEQEQKKPTGPTPTYLPTTAYDLQPLPPTLPSTLDGSVPIPFPHLLGFLNTPIRLYRYLNRRYLADEIGRDVAALVLASSSRPYSETTTTTTTTTSSDPSTTAETLETPTPEQTIVLIDAERDWHKSVHRTDDANPDKEREWLDPIVLDPRLASRMHRYTVSPEEEARATRIAHGEEYILGEERPAPVPVWKRLWIKYGYGEDEETLKRRPILGNLDNEDGE
ncbi:Tim22-complex subunit TIM54 [Aspergillus saccharolyticus JOP 1030-1]|uniref:Mitochondrial import inner membrane translocase subunit TIM54 n=1 Tax=Aspergillus saccharolyticus JOP 1030-1 TaxID=1450539 RepID=A0A319A0W6_9EURO|nr:hypothetical protein BP01DRAFT_317808 [Aspergillus saccharolyticus JOP 1030-1]PYH45938.1 hypothetical protein BP01DRAFT_317808 [Aspergillus saccharolyticus JOP 1030-1]